MPRVYRDLTKTPTKLKREVNERALIAAILADPDDDAPRAVYADWLTERGDPRGELITVQLAKKQTPALKARADALLAKHKKAWVGRFGGQKVEYGFTERRPNTLRTVASRPRAAWARSASARSSSARVLSMFPLDSRPDS